MNLLEAKIYYDGSNWIAIPHTERPYIKSRPRDRPEKSMELQQFEQRFEKVKGGRAKRNCHFSVFEFIYPTKFYNHYQLHSIYLFLYQNY